MNKANPRLKDLPDTPGVYFFLGDKRKILYIGKATSLRNRVKSYFSGDIAKTRGRIVQKMLEEARSIDYRATDSVLEALILEASLIKTYKPTYNSREKDDKSYNYLIITNEAYPRVLIVRGKELDQKFKSKDIKYVFGPFPEGILFKEAVRLVRKIFPFRDTCIPFGEEKSTHKRVALVSLQKSKFSRSSEKNVRGCFNAQIGLCPGVCNGTITRQKYARTIRNIKLLFEGKKPALIRTLKKEMNMLAKKYEFEEAQKIKKTLFALEHINDVKLLKRDVRELMRGQGVYRIEAYDVAHTGGSNMVGTMVVVQNGEPKKSDYRKFRIKSVSGINDTKALEEILRRRLHHDEWRLPNVIVVDGGQAHKNSALRVLLEFGYEIPVVAIVKDEYHRAREIRGEQYIIREHERAIVLANSEAHRFSISYHRKERGR